jgi:hypothetical protein
VTCSWPGGYHRLWTSHVHVQVFEFLGKKPVPVETIADNSIVNRLERDGFIDKLYSKR